MTDKSLEFVLIKKQGGQFTASAANNYIFDVLPRTGEFIEISNSEDEPGFYRVIAVVHDGENPDSRDIYVELFAPDGVSFHQKLIHGEL